MRGYILWVSEKELSRQIFVSEATIRRCTKEYKLGQGAKEFSALGQKSRGIISEEQGSAVGRFILSNRRAFNTSHIRNYLTENIG